MDFDESKGGRLAGAKKSLILGSVADVPETYSNCKQFFDKIQLSTINYQGKDI